MNKTYKLENGISTLEKDDEEIHKKIKQISGKQDRRRKK
jgi:hypothetical protein